MSRKKFTPRIVWNEFSGKQSPDVEIPSRATVTFSIGPHRSDRITVAIRERDGHVVLDVSGDGTLAIIPVASNAVRVRRGD